ncbi:MAG TPA: undecaprenyl-diphosphate phosphatase, partial [Brevibacillus sp.]|nr:undecaprenyl-diphosphate phosphatase [Brevibacillus sp.]
MGESSQTAVVPTLFSASAARNKTSDQESQDIDDVRKIGQFAFEDYFEEISRTGVTIGWEFLATGVILWTVESMRKGHRRFEQINYTDALIIGTLQGAAILPAISRSGLTIAGSLLRGIDRADAARFSFLLSLPAILGACTLQTVKLTQNPLDTPTLIPMIVGTFFAAVAGYFAIRCMLKIISIGSMKG